MMDIPAFGFSTSMTRPRTASPLDVDPYDVQARQGRLKAFSDYINVHPGAAPNGSGETGLQSTDAAGWSHLLERQQQFLKDDAAERGAAGPSVRFGGYSGGVLGGSDEGSGAGGRMPSQAMSGLRSAVGGAKPGRSGSIFDEDLPAGVRGDPEMFKALQLSQLDRLQGEGRQARRTALDPRQLATEKLDTDLMRAPFDRTMEYDDTMNTADAKSDAYFTHGRPMALDQNEMAGQLADRRGLAATYDDLIRTGGQRDVATINAGVQDRRTGVMGNNAAIGALQREVGNQRQFGDVDPAAQSTLNSRMGVGGPPAAPAPAGAPGPVGAPGGAPGGKVLTRQQLLDTAQAQGWTEQQALQEARQRGYTVQ